MSTVSQRPRLEPLEDRTVPSVVAANFANGLWRHDTSTGSWAHLSNFQATHLEVDDAGNVYGLFKEVGLWRWSAAAGWQKLSDAAAGEINVTGGGVLYATLGATLGTWRWSSDGWMKLSSFAAEQMAVSDSDAFFGRYSVGSAGTWRWTPQAGWLRLTSALNETNNIHLQTDDAGDLVGIYTTGQNTYGLWRWSPTSGWKLLDSAASFTYVVSELGQIYVANYHQTPGTFLYDPSDPNPAFTKIAGPVGGYLFPDPQGHLWVIAGNGGNTSTLSFYSVLSGLSVMLSDLAGFQGDATVGKDGFLFLKTNTGLYRYGPASGLVQLTAATVYQFEAEGYDFSQAVNLN